FVVTAAGKFLACNSAFALMLGLSTPEQAMESGLESFFAEPGRWEQILSTLKASKSMHNDEVALKRADGQLVFAIGNLVAKSDKRGELSEIHGYLFDLTGRNLLQDQLRQPHK